MLVDKSSPETAFVSIIIAQLQNERVVYPFLNSNLTNLFESHLKEDGTLHCKSALATLKVASVLNSLE